MIVCLDANCVIYLVERNPIWGPKLIGRLASATANGDVVAACGLARAECLIGPLKSGEAAILADYQRFFSSSAIRMLPITPAVCEQAARLRVASLMTIKLPDALHLAAAIEHGCGCFLTNDAQLVQCRSIPVEVLT